jgi:diguanylate cyclase (GGDEF)-like protein
VKSAPHGVPTAHSYDKMSQIIDYLTEITGFRDRESLDLALVAGLKEMISPVSVGIYRPVGDPQDLRWLTCARQKSDDLVASADPAWVELSTLPRLADHPDRCCALQGHPVRTTRGDAQVSFFPMITDRGINGVLEAETAEVMDEAVRSMVCGVLHVYCNFQNALDYGERDTLTGLLNRKTFDERFYKSVQTLAPAPDEPGRRRKKREGRRWVGMIDIDFFKAVNDRFGHLIGDEVLLLLSRLMGASLRTQDQLYRFGGEEFVALLACADAADATHTFERLRRKTEGFDFPQVGHVTISVGFTEIFPGDSASSALGRADRAVYRAKAKGRNQVQDHERLVAAGELADPARAGEIELF